MKVIFMGTPEFAIPALEKLIDDSEFEIVAVYTREPQIAGRGHKVMNSPIHELALKNNLKVITPKSLRDTESQTEFVNFKADIAVVVAYGLILPKAILEGTKLGCINIHPSILPRWRGAAPIERTIMAGDEMSGVAIMKMDVGLDNGDVIFQEKFALDNDVTAKELEPKLAKMGADLMLKTLKVIDKKDLVLTKQNEDLVTYAKKLIKEEAAIDWKLSAREINNKIRGLNNSFGAYFIYKNERIKIFKAAIIENNHGNCGEILSKNFTISCGKDTIQPLVLQRPGKNALKIEDFLRGFSFEVGEVLN